MKCNEIYCQGWCYEVNYVVVRLDISSTTLTFSDRENCHLPGIVFINKKVLIVFIPWTDELESLEVLKWIQKSHTVVWIFFLLFSYLSNRWSFVPLIRNLHTSVSSHSCKWQHLPSWVSVWNKFTLFEDRGRRFTAYCLYMAKEGRCEDPSWGHQSVCCKLVLCSFPLLQAQRDQRPSTDHRGRPSGQLLVQKSWSLSKQRQQSFPQSNFYRSCAKFFHPLEVPHHTVSSVMQCAEVRNSE